MRMPPSAWIGSMMTAQVLSVMASSARKSFVVRRIGHEARPLDERAEAAAIFLLAGERDGGDGPAVEAALEGDDLDAIGATFDDRLIALGQLDRGLVGFGAGVAEEDARRAHGVGTLGDGARAQDLVLVPIEVRDVDELHRLLGDGGGEPEVRVAERRGRDAAGQVEVAIAGDVPHLAAGAATQHDRLLLVVVREEAVRLFHQLPLLVLGIDHVRSAYSWTSSVPTPVSVKTSSRTA